MIGEGLRDVRPVIKSWSPFSPHPARAAVVCRSGSRPNEIVAALNSLIEFPSLPTDGRFRGAGGGGGVVYGGGGWWLVKG